MTTKLNRFLRKRYTENIIKYKKELNYLTSRRDYYVRYYDKKIASLMETYKYIDASNSEKEAMLKIFIDKKESFLEREAKSVANRTEKIGAKISKRNLQIAEIDENNEDLKEIIAKHEIEIMNDDSIHLEIQNLSMHFGGLKAVDQLSFSVRKGEIFGLIGPNGAGKTTIFNCVTQFYESTAGKVYFREKNNEVVSLNNYNTYNVIDLGIARTFQNIELVWELNVIDNLLVGAHSLYTSNIFTQLLRLPKIKIEEDNLKHKAYEILKRLGILEYAYYYPLGLPYGILKKIELARSLMTNPKLIILDEPAAGLNDKETQELAVIIREIKEEFDLTILLVEHDMGLVMTICDTVCAISFGKKLAIGTPKEIQNNIIVQTAYLGGE